MGLLQQRIFDGYFRRNPQDGTAGNYFPVHTDYV